MMRLTKLIFALAALLVAPFAAHARVQIDITQGNVDPMPIAVPEFISAGGADPDIGRDITGVVMADLDRSGLFAVIDQRAYIENLTSVNVRPKFADWRLINAQVLVVGEVTQLADGRIEVATRVWTPTPTNSLAPSPSRPRRTTGAARRTRWRTSSTSRSPARTAISTPASCSSTSRDRKSGASNVS